MKDKLLVIWTITAIAGCFICAIMSGCRKESPTPAPTETVIISLTSDKDSLPADGASSLTITARVIYSDSTLGEGLEVRFSTSLGKITTTDTADANGIATTTLISDTVAGVAEITARCDKIAKSVNITFSPLESEDISVYSITAYPSTIPANGVSKSTISAVFKHTTGAPACSILVSFSTTLGSITANAPTDTNGLAEAVLTSSVVPGISTVKTWYGSARDSVSVTFTESGGDTIPASVVLYSVNPATVAVRGSGGNETSTLVFQVRDKAGQPTSGTHTVDFAIDGGPGGGEYLSPTSVSTDASALATTHLNSGTVSGPVRITAQVYGTNIYSGPVQITVVGGPPDQAHFCISTEKLNLYAFGRTGVEDIITAYLGDIYGNPVLDSTAVWFNTDCGLIQPGSAGTVLGIASNTLVSCAPWPVVGNGLFYVHGWTVDANGNTIKDSTRVLWSGNSRLEVTPSSFNIPNGGYASFTIRAYDSNNNPLVGGTSIAVTADKGELHGETSILIPDTQSPSWTQFQFELWDDEPDTVDARSSKISVQLDSENGDKIANVYGTIN